MRPSNYDTMRTSMLKHWAETGEVPTTHIDVGKLNGVSIKVNTRHAPRAVLQRAHAASNYAYLAITIELARRGPPQGFNDIGYSAKVGGWLCFDVNEGWRPILVDQEG